MMEVEVVNAPRFFLQLSTIYHSKCRMNQKNYLYLHEERRSRSIELEKKTTYEEDYQSLGGNVGLQLHRMFA